jgi:hypothetical protein
MDAANGGYLLFMDDDDEYVEGVFPEVRKVVHDNPGKLILGLMKHRTLGVLWREKTIRVANLGTQMVVVPNTKELPRWGNLYESDFYFIADVRLPVFWWPQLICIHHPCPENPSRI